MRRPFMSLVCVFGALNPHRLCNVCESYTGAAGTQQLTAACSSCGYHCCCMPCSSMSLLLSFITYNLLLLQLSYMSPSCLHALDVIGPCTPSTYAAALPTATPHALLQMAAPLISQALAALLLQQTAQQQQLWTTGFSGRRGSCGQLCLQEAMQQQQHLLSWTRS